MSKPKLAALGAALIILLPQAASPPASPGADVAWLPEYPRQGTLIRVVITPDTARGVPSNGLPVEGTLAGQPLHFDPLDHGRYQAIAAIPVSARASIPLVLTVTPDKGDPEHRFVRIPVAPAEFPVFGTAGAHRRGTRGDAGGIPPLTGHATSLVG
jgi:hypothetical protein